MARATTDNRQPTTDNRQPTSKLEERVFFDEEGALKENLLIKGNNLLALHALRPRLAGQVKLIYIDPPYNTGNDGFKYNDNFNHSSWLVFMKNRLEVARDLLRDDGVICVHCDDNEQAYLKVLMDEIFGRENFVGDLIRKTKSQTNDAKNGLNYQHDFILIYGKDKNEVVLIGEKKDLSKYKNPDNDASGAWITDNPSARSGSEKAKFAIKNPHTGTVDYPPQGRYWAFSQETFEHWVSIGKVKFHKEVKEGQRGFIVKKYLNELRNEYNLLNSLFASENHFMNQVATKELNILFPDKNFTYPKPEALIERLIACATQPGDIVLDYHLGSGTTAAVAHKMGRRWIGIEQMDYIEDIAKTRLQKVIEGEQGGISKQVGWQGGGSFCYFELKKYNQEYRERIEASSTFSELKNVFDEMKKNAFLEFWFDEKDFKEEQEYGRLDLWERKELLLSLLDENMMYLPLRDMNDEKYQISEEDKSLTKKFYGEAR